MSPSSLRRIAVFCGSAPGSHPRFLTQATAVGRALAERGIDVVYGGAVGGCMGAVADGALQAGGAVIGVLPRGLAAREIGHPGITRLEIVDSMHERKARMAELTDAVLALPGGYGTYDEVFEALTWSQLGIDRKPIGLLDAQEFWAPFLAMLDATAAAGFLAPANRSLLTAAADLPTLLDRMTAALSVTAGAVASAPPPPQP